MGRKEAEVLCAKTDNLDWIRLARLAFRCKMISTDSTASTIAIMALSAIQLRHRIDLFEVLSFKATLSPPLLLLSFWTDKKHVNEIPA